MRCDKWVPSKCNRYAIVLKYSPFRGRVFSLASLLTNEKRAIFMGRSTFCGRGVFYCELLR